MQGTEDMATTKAQPSSNGPDGDRAGRDAQGRFAAGNKLGKGNPFAARVAKLRSELLKAVTPADIRGVVRKLITQAKSGDLPAIKELLDRVLGKPLETDVFDKLENLERLVDEFTAENQNT